MATTTWQATGRSNTSCGNVTSGNEQTYSSFNVRTNDDYLNAVKCTKLTYTAWHTRTGMKTTNIHVYLNWGNGTTINMGTTSYAFNSSSATKHNYTKNFTETTTPTCYEVAAAVRSGFVSRRITWSPKNDGGDNCLYYRGVSSQPIAVTATFDSTPTPNNYLRYYNGNEWKICQASYYDGTDWVLVDPSYFINGSFKILG